jgi:hypothetical protein
MSAVDPAVCADSSGGAAGWHRFRVTVLVVAVALNLAAQAVDRLCPGGLVAHPSTRPVIRP